MLSVPPEESGAEVAGEVMERAGDRPPGRALVVLLFANWTVRMLLICAKRVEASSTELDNTRHRLVELLMALIGRRADDIWSVGSRA